MGDPMTENKPGKAHLKIVISAAFLLAATVLTVQYISLARQTQLLKTDLAEINHIRYGLLNVDEWSDQVSAILSIKILQFKLTPENRERLVQNLENILYQLIDEVESMMKAKSQGPLSGITDWLPGFTISLDPFRDSVPSYAGQLLDELNKPESRVFLQQFLTNKLNDLTASTYNLDPMDPLHTIMDRYGCIDKELCRDLIRDEIDLKNRAVNLRVFLIMGLIVLLFLTNLITRKKINAVQATLLILGTLCLLVGGVTTPMIDLEAKIDHLMLQLMGEKITFLNNIIFFQSKSITNVVSILMEDGTLPMIFVGCLIFTFSIIFPSLKIVSSVLYSYSPGRIRENRLIRFFVFKSGKWSMADVMVVAIFMAYIGFNGIISYQLDQLQSSSDSVEIFTTNGTQLLSGFYLFLLFCISSLFLSEIITRKT